MKLGTDYIQTFLTSHHPYDYAKEHIIYPRRAYSRKYDDGNIKALSRFCPFAQKTVALKRCRPSLLEYHLRESSKNMVNGFPSWRVESYVSNKEEGEKVYGSRWILTSYYEDAFVNFIQLDIDRHHPSDDENARSSVSILLEAAKHYGFEVVWTTSPGYLGKDGEVIHGLYAWIRLDAYHFVMDIRPHVLGFLNSIGLSGLANKHEGAYLKKKKLVRLPGQFNVELADPVSFSKIHAHTPVEASLAFQEAWSRAGRFKSDILTSITPLSPPISHSGVSTHSSVTPPPLSPQGDTFDMLRKWGRAIVNQHYPDSRKRQECVSSLIQMAEKNLPSVSRTRQDHKLLESKAQRIIDFLWTNTNPQWIGTRQSDDEDEARFAPHAAYIRDSRNDLLSLLPERLRPAGDQILDLLLKFHGRVAANQIYHKTPTPICTFRNWTIIRDAWELTTLVEYEKRTGKAKGTCKQWGFDKLTGRQADPEQRLKDQSRLQTAC